MGKSYLNLLFYFSLTLYLIGRCLEYSIWLEHLYSFIVLIKNISYIIMTPCILFSLYNLGRLNLFSKKIIILIILLLFYLYYLIHFDTNAGFVCLGFSIATIGIPKDKLFKYLQYIFISLLVSFIFLGLFSHNVTVRLMGDTRNRYSFGFSDPYSMQMMWMSISSCSIIIHKRKNLLYYVTLLIPAIILQLLGDSRTTFISNILLLWCDYFAHHRCKSSKKYINSKVINSMKTNIFNICFLIMNFLCWIYYKNNNQFLIKLDRLFTGRISMSSRFLKYVLKGNISFYPVNDVKIDLSAVAALPALALDSSYASMLLINGLLYSLVTLMLLYFYIKKIIEYRDVDLLVVLIISAICGLLQPTLISILYNPVLLLMASSLFDGNNYRKEFFIDNRRIKYAN